MTVTVTGAGTDPRTDGVDERKRAREQGSKKSKATERTTVYLGDDRPVGGGGLRYGPSG